LIDSEDFSLDLLFFHHRLRLLVTIELKLGRFKAAQNGQMELYLKWLDKHERQPGEEAPIGLILCAESSREQVELLQMHEDGITVAEYWTELPPKAELERQLHATLVEARESLARRGMLFCQVAHVVQIDSHRSNADGAQDRVLCLSHQLSQIKPIVCVLRVQTPGHSWGVHVASQRSHRKQ
jgi:hypothetical protein